ncbi:hypothetical protein C8Q75DRAFT_802538 [Abortiporus biennis]|nr:hypothetical protein C8Q75DRAFT_802538 [Abortiporus biennis]
MVADLEAQAPVPVTAEFSDAWRNLNIATDPYLRQLNASLSNPVPATASASATSPTEADNRWDKPSQLNINPKRTDSNNTRSFRQVASLQKKKPVILEPKNPDDSSIHKVLFAAGLLFFPCWWFGAFYKAGNNIRTSFTYADCLPISKKSNLNSFLFRARNVSVQMPNDGYDFIDSNNCAAYIIVGS